jgi:mannosyl-3-phosphoglycerate phosphatase
MNLLVFTDLDGTLLDHDDYACDAARPALDLIRRRRVPLIFTTSKTRVEVERLQAELQIREPFIPENGAALFFPAGYRNFEIENGVRDGAYTVVPLGAAYAEIRRFVVAVRERFGVTGFGDWSVAEIAARTGLPLETAAMARMREFTEPFLIEDPRRIEELAAVAEPQGLQITAGGRFFHLIGIRQDKGRAVRRCTEIFASHIAGRIVTAGLGDSANDIAMLKSVDIPILIPHPDGTYETVELPGLVRADVPGSRGWNEAVIRLFDRFDRSGSERRIG